MSAKITSQQFMQAILTRRSTYHIKPTSALSDKALTELVGTAVTNCPTAFNMQATRVILLLGERNKKFWADMWAANEKTLTSEEHRLNAKKKWDGAYISSYGTILYFDDTKTLNDWIEKTPVMKDTFPVWAKNAQGIVQQTLWCALATEGIGATLQHFPQFTPGTGEAMRASLPEIPKEWEFSAIMPFGDIVEHPDPKPKLPLDERMMVIQ